jgi:DNA-binding transcriptional LysR family regulator
MRIDGWLGIELRHLSAFRAVVEERSFSRAAVRLGYTQSAISHQISSLERIVGHRLLNRQIGSGRVTLTRAGERLNSHAERLLDRLSAAEADLAALRDDAVGALCVGTYESIGARVLPHAIRSFSAERPDVEVRLVESCDDAFLFEKLEEGSLDLVFTAFPLPAGPFSAVELLSDPYVLVVAASAATGREGPADPRSIETLPLIGWRRCKSFELVEAYLRNAGVEPRIVSRADHNATIQGLVAAGMGAAFMPLLTVDASDVRTRAVELDPPLPARTIVAAWHRDRQEAAATAAFVAATHEAVASFNSPPRKANHTSIPNRSQKRHELRVVQRNR